MSSSKNAEIKISEKLKANLAKSNLKFEVSPKNIEFSSLQLDSLPDKSQLLLVSSNKTYNYYEPIEARYSGYLCKENHLFYGDNLVVLDCIRSYSRECILEYLETKGKAFSLKAMEKAFISDSEKVSDFIMSDLKEMFKVSYDKDEDRFEKFLNNVFVLESTYSHKEDYSCGCYDSCCYESDYVSRTCCMNSVDYSSMNTNKTCYIVYVLRRETEKEIKARIKLVNTLYQKEQKEQKEQKPQKEKKIKNTDKLPEKKTKKTTKEDI